MGTAQPIFALKKNICNYIIRCKDLQDISNVLILKS